MFTVRSLSACEVPPHLANVLRNVYLRKPIDFVLERICLRILVPRIVIVVMLPHSVIGPHYTVDSSDVMYQLRRNYWRCALTILANVAREEMPGLVPLPNRP